ncbi:MAG: glycosyltransferase, partial [Pseudobutyrivibrio sp.]|nr:glycosyltransferase [Pseudobutyrivibrio sp.]
MINKEKNFISAIVYVHNAAGRIESFLNTVIDVLQDNFEHSEIICVNDSSKDNSADIIKEVSKRAVSTNITILNMSYFHGLETAMNAGIDLSIGDFVIEFDKTVLDFDAEEIMKVYRRSLEGYDIVSASADRRQSFTSHIFYRVFARFGNLRSELSTESFRVLSRRVINRISSMNKTVPYRKAVYANCGLKTDNIKYSPIADAITTINDKQEKRYRTDLAVDSLILFTEIGYRFSIYMTSLMIFITV